MKTCCTRSASRLQTLGMAVILETDVNASNDLGRLKIDAAINETTEPCSDQSFAQKTGTNAKDLEAFLLHKKELVLDFKSLKSCLDPLNETVVSKDTEKDGEQVRMHVQRRWVGLV